MEQESERKTAGLRGACLARAKAGAARATAWALASLLLLVFGPGAEAQELIVIDITDPAAVTFTTTGAAPSANGGNVPGIDGIDFLQFFTAEIAGYRSGDLSPSNLAPSQDSSEPYHSWNTDSYSGSNIDLNFYSDQGSSQHFNTTSPAFSGSATVDFTGFTAYLPTNGATGQISDGNSGDASGPSRPLTILGTWKAVSAVPEPSVSLLVGLGGVVLLARLGRLRKSGLGAESGRKS